MRRGEVMRPDGFEVNLLATDEVPRERGKTVVLPMCHVISLTAKIYRLIGKLCRKYPARVALSEKLLFFPLDFISDIVLIYFRYALGFFKS